MRLVQRRTGISPMISAVMLIAFTMAVATILTAWVTQFTQEQTGAVSNQSERQIRCSYAQIAVHDATFVNSSDRIDVTAENTGTVDLHNISVFALTAAAVQNHTYISALDVGRVKTGKIIYTRNAKPDSVRVTSRDCPGASDEERDITTVN